jgi:hypothetical protein
MVIGTVGVLAMTSPAFPQQVRWIDAGTLSCQVAPSVGLIIGSRQNMQCIFRSRVTGKQERYSGTMGRLGLDVGFSAAGQLVWRVRTSTTRLGARELAGTYSGASGDISVGAGVGANVLVGGSNRTVSLQPLSVKGQVGANLALGVASLTLN